MRSDRMQATFGAFLALGAGSPGWCAQTPYSPFCLHFFTPFPSQEHSNIPISIPHTTATMEIPESEGSTLPFRPSLISSNPSLRPTADTLTATFHPLSNAFTQKRTIKLTNGQCTPIGRHTEPGEPSTAGLRFVSKVVSRNHAVVFGVDGKVGFYF